MLAVGGTPDARCDANACALAAIACFWNRHDELGEPGNKTAGETFTCEDSRSPQPSHGTRARIMKRTIPFVLLCVAIACAGAAPSPPAPAPARSAQLAKLADARIAAAEHVLANAQDLYQKKLATAAEVMQQARLAFLAHHDSGEHGDALVRAATQYQKTVTPLAAAVTELGSAGAASPVDVSLATYAAYWVEEAKTR